MDGPSVVIAGGTAGSATIWRATTSSVAGTS